MIKQIAIILTLLMSANPITAQESGLPYSTDNWHIWDDRNPCQGEADRCYAWRGKLEHCQSAVVSFHYSPYEMDLTHISAVLENIEVTMPGRPDTVRKIASLKSKGPGRLRVHGEPVTVLLEPGCELRLAGYEGLFSYPTGQLTCRITFDDEDPSWTAEIGSAVINSANIPFYSVYELPPSTAK